MTGQKWLEKFVHALLEDGTYEDGDTEDLNKVMDAAREASGTECGEGYNRMTGLEFYERYDKELKVGDIKDQQIYNAKIKGALEENKLILEAFQNKDSKNRQIVTQPMTYFSNRIKDLQAKLDKEEKE